VILTRIYEDPEIFEYLDRRNLLEKYRKSKRALLESRGTAPWTVFRKRHPFSQGIWYFRIDGKYRAHFRFVAPGEIVVFFIDDHQ
jgi:hypothetical protein